MSRLSYNLLRAKHVLVLLLCIVAALEVSLTFGQSHWPQTSLHFYTAFVGLLGYLLILPIQRYNHTRTRRSSDILLWYWLAHIIASAAKFRTELTYPSPPVQTHLADFVLFSIRAGLAVVVFSIECAGVEIGTLETGSAKINGVSQHAQNGGYERVGNGNGVPDGSAFSVFSEGARSEVSYDATAQGEKECPINTANMFSRISFHWLQPLMTVGIQSTQSRGRPFH